MDDFGIGQMQYYPMDSIAAKDDDQVFSFDIDPDQHRQWNRFLNNASNFIFYHKLGNVTLALGVFSKELTGRLGPDSKYSNRIYCTSARFQYVTSVVSSA